VTERGVLFPSTRSPRSRKLPSLDKHEESMRVGRVMSARYFASIASRARCGRLPSLCPTPSLSSAFPSLFLLARFNATPSKTRRDPPGIGPLRPRELPQPDVAAFTAYNCTGGGRLRPPASIDDDGSVNKYFGSPATNPTIQPAETFQTFGKLRLRNLQLVDSPLPLPSPSRRLLSEQSNETKSIKRIIRRT